MDMGERGWHIMAVLGALSKLCRPHDETSAEARAVGHVASGERVQPHHGSLGPLRSPSERDHPPEEPRGGSSRAETDSTPFSYVSPLPVSLCRYARHAPAGVSLLQSRHEPRLQKHSLTLSTTALHRIAPHGSRSARDMQALPTLRLGRVHDSERARALLGQHAIRQHARCVPHTC